MITTSTSNGQFREYRRSESAVFLKTKAKYGGLSNMAGGFPLKINGVDIRTSEALYQACRFPHYPDVQRLIIGQRSPMSAKMKSKPYRDRTRPDWDRIRVKIMRWCLRVKLVQNREKFGDALLETRDLPIVEQSRRDDFWGAKPINDQTLIGVNALGRLLMELREFIRHKPGASPLLVEPLAIPDFLLDGREIEPICFRAESDALPLATAGESVVEVVREPQAEMDDPVKNVGVATIVTTDNRIDLNTASVEDLKTLPGIGPKLANAIIAHREQYGSFNAAEEITAVHRNLRQKAYDKLKHLIKIDNVHHKGIFRNAFSDSSQLSLYIGETVA